MVTINYVSNDGVKIEVTASSGETIMSAAVKAKIAGIDADCGGACSCATCHVYIGESWLDKVGVASDMEEDMLDFAVDVRENSRLSCQIEVSDELDGIMVYIPESQF